MVRWWLIGGVFVVATLFSTAAHGQGSKLEAEGVSIAATGPVRGKNKLCCGYPLSEEKGFKLTYYWMADENRHLELTDNKEVYTQAGELLGVYPQRFVDELRMEGSGWLSDGRVVNYAGRCSYGVGTCFEELDPNTHPYGRGSGRRPLIPFQSVAVDRRYVKIGDTVYIPELDGMPLPYGGIHDGCVRADDTGGAIKLRKFDFYVLEEDNFRWIYRHLWGVRWFTPHVEAPRCHYLRR